jgi:hypothetical protein
MLSFIKTDWLGTSIRKMNHSPYAARGMGACLSRLWQPLSPVRYIDYKRFATEKEGGASMREDDLTKSGVVGQTQPCGAMFRASIIPLPCFQVHSVFHNSDHHDTKIAIDNIYERSMDMQALFM